MKKFALKKMAEVLLPCLATSAAFAEPPSPPPVQPQDGRTVREGARTNAPATPAAQAVVQTFPYDPLKIKPREDPFYSNMVGIPYASFLLYPEIVLTHGYDSNIYAERKNETSDLVTTISPVLVAKSKWDRHTLNFGMGADADIYMHHSAENVTDYWLGAGGQFDFSENSYVFGNLFHSHNHEDRGSADAVPGLTPTQYNSTEANVGFARKDGAISTSARLDSEKLDFSTPAGAVSPYNNDDRSRRQDSVVARVGYAVSPALEPFIQAEADARRYDKTLDDNGFQRSSDGYRVALGMEFRPSPNLQGEAYIGQMHQKFDDSRFADVNQPYFGADLSWKPLAGTTATAFLERTLEETTVSGASSSVDTTLGAKVEKVLSQNMLVNGRMAYTRSDFKGVGRNDEILDAGAGLKYYVTPTVFLGADYRFVNRDSNELFANYYRNQAMFSVGYTPGRKRLNPDGSTGGGWLDYLGEGAEGVLHASITPKLYAFSNGGGFRNDRVGFLERYDYREDSFSDGHQRDGLIADLDLALVYADAKRDVLVLERDGFGINNQRTNLKADSDAVKFKAYNNIFTSATGGIDFRYNPNQVVGGTDPTYALPANTGESQHVGTFSFDSPDTLYSVKRSSNGASVEFKPAVFDGNGAVVVSYDGYSRRGNRVANYELPNALLNGGTNAEPLQWRGYSQPIDERNNRFAVNLSLTPANLFNLNYELAVDKFQNNASAITLANLSQWSGIPFGGGAGFSALATPGLPLNFVADSTLITNDLRFSKQLGKSAVLAAGYSKSSLKQDSFTDIQTANGYANGKTGTDSAYVTGKFNLSQLVGLEAFYRYSKRENNSTYPAGDLINPVFNGASSSTSYERMVMPRINKIETSSYGLEASLYPQFLKTSLSAGWKHEDKDRDFTFGTDAALVAPIMLYSAKSSSDEVYLKLVSRPAKGWTIRLTPSYLWSDQTGLVSEPEEAIQVKTQVTYSKPEWHELFVSGYYNYKQTENGLLGYANYNVTGAGGAGVAGNPQSGAFGTEQAQKAKNTQQSAGLNLNMVPRESLKLNLGYDWSQTDFSTYYFTSNRIRFHYLTVPSSATLTSLDFLILDNPGYKVDTQTISAGGEWQRNKYTYSGHYSYSWSKGHNANGLGGQSLPAVDASVNNVLQTLSFGVEYALKSSLSLKGSYIYDNYKDRVYNELSGDLHTIMVSISYRI